MLEVETAQQKILDFARIKESYRVPILDALGFTIAENVQSDTDLPPFDNSAVDGFAVRSQDIASASLAAPVELKIAGDSHAGTPFFGELSEGSAVRIMTGAPIPKNADACIMVEDTKIDRDGFVQIHESLESGRHMRLAGEDVQKKDIVLWRGMHLGAAEIAMLAAVGVMKPLVYKKPRVVIVSTGDEIVDPAESSPLPYGEIRNSNLYALAALVRESGGEVHSMVHIADDYDQTENTFRTLGDMQDVDLIVTAGGVSMGDRDFIKPALEKIGTLEFWKIAIKPGKPLAFGRIADKLVFGLPGNPVSAMVTFELFVRPVIRKMSGISDDSLFRLKLEATAGSDIEHIPGRQEFIRAHLTSQDGRLTAIPTGDQGSGIMTSMIGANSYIVVPIDVSNVKAGDRITVMMLA